MLKKALIRPPRLRTEAGEERERHATWLELFYDLVLVVAVSQVAHVLSLDHSPKGIVIAIGLFVPVWWVWAGHTVYATRFDTDDLVYRLLTFLQMFAIMGRTALHIQPRPFPDWHHHDERRYDSCHHGEPHVRSVIRYGHTPCDRVWPVGGRGLHDGLRHMPRRGTRGAFSVRGHISDALSSRICKQVSHAGNDGLSTISLFPPARVYRRENTLENASL